MNIPKGLGQCLVWQIQLWCHYNAVNFLPNIHKIHPTARSLGSDMGCPFRVLTVINTLPQSLQWCMQYHDVLYNAPGCTWNRLLFFAWDWYSINVNLRVFFSLVWFFTMTMESVKTMSMEKESTRVLGKKNIIWDMKIRQRKNKVSDIYL